MSVRGDRSDLGSPVSVPVNTDTVVISLPITMPEQRPWSPSVGGPWRVRVNWSIIFQNNASLGSSTLHAWVDDGAAAANLFADAAGAQPLSGSSAIGALHGSGISRNTYADGETVTFDLVIRNSGGLAGSVLTGDGFVLTHLDLAVEPQ